MPDPIRLIADESFSSPMVYMGKRETSVRTLKNKRLGALNENKNKMDVAIDLYAKGKIPNYVTAEKLVDRLASKSQRADFICRTDKEFGRIVGKYKDAESVKGMLERGREQKRARDATVTLLLFREEDKERNEESTVNVDFPKGTTVASALAPKKGDASSWCKDQKIKWP